MVDDILQLRAENQALRADNEALRADNSILRAEIAGLRQLVTLLMEKLDVLSNQNATLKEENQRLKDEIAILKKQKPRPKIPPNTLEGSGSPDKRQNCAGRGKHPRKSKTVQLVIHQTVAIRPESLPADAIFKGFLNYTVQDIQIENNNTVYRLERWLLPDGTYATGKLPKGVEGHYGVELRAWALKLHYECRVTEPLLLQIFRSIGVLISAGQLSRILIEGKESFHQEKEELLAAGIEATGQIQVDDIGARDQGKNAYTTVIGNALFAFFSTSHSKSRVNFLKILHGGKPQYLLNDDAWTYIFEQNPSSCLRHRLESVSLATVMDQKDWDLFLKKNGIESDGLVRLATEGALFASLIEHGIPRDLRIHADDAGQFAVFINSLCWIHEERHYRKFQVFNPETEQAIANVRGQIWKLYKGLKAYKEAPSESEKTRLEREIDALFKQTTSSTLLNERLSLTYEKKERLLMVLSCPTTPLHNNATETDGRAGVVIKKVSGGTRSDNGRDARDTFLSLVRTAQKLKVGFLDYLRDRLSGANKIPRFGDLIRAGGYQPAAP